MPGHNKLASLPRPFLVYVTDRLALHSAETGRLSALMEKIDGMVHAGIHVQIREKDLSGRQLAAITREAVRRAQGLHAPPSGRAGVIVNDRIDVALAEGAAGVHLGERSLPAQDARQLLDIAVATKIGLDSFLMGVSCHSVESAQRTAEAGADYIFFGPVFVTPSKIAFGEPQGLSRLGEVCRAVRIPVVAIGGVTLHNARSCADAGAAGIAAIRAFQDARDPRELAAALCERFD